MSKITGPRVAFISDIHLGVHQNSQTWHDIAINYAYWLKDQLHDQGIKDLIIAGDIFHNRHEIGVNTLHVAYRFFKILEDFNIVAISGNHDAYRKNTSDINSISILNGKNITIYDSLHQEIINGKKITFCPWGTELTDIPTCDIIIGHFEIINFRMNQIRVCDHGLQTDGLLDKADMIITGHFHYREHRKYENGKSIIYLGSPHELDFGDRDQVKGITIIDTNTLNVEFIENTVSPKHKNISVSKLSESTPEEIEKLVSNNIISLHVDTKTSPQNVDLILSKFGGYKPLQMRTEFSTFEENYVNAEDLESLSFDIETAIHEFVNLLTADVSKKDILDKCIEVYKLSQTSHE
jgi:DNA repair exonuclease SbcCD nuclease subunit